MKRWIGVAFTFSAVLTSLGILAETDQSFYPEHFFHSNFHAWFAGVGAGMEELFFQHRNDYLLTSPFAPPTSPDLFALSTGRATNGLLSVFVGRQWRPVLDGRINLFLEYDHFSSVLANGARFNTFDNSSYEYDVAHQALLLGAKVNLADWHQLLPYVEMGIGVSRNEFTDFNNPTINSQINPFPNHVNYDLSYVVGMGIDVAMQNNWLLSFGYRFGEWGSLESGNVTSVPAPPIGTGQALNPIRLTNNLYSNQALIKMSYIFSS